MPISRISIAQVQGRPLNVNHEAACFIGKTEGEVEKGALRLKVGGKSMHFFQWKIKVGGEVKGFCFITPGGDGRPCSSFTFFINQTMIKRNNTIQGSKHT